MLHGGDIYTEGIFKGRELLDYSSNINPLGMPKGFYKNINEALENATRYPDIKYRKLREGIKEYTGIREAQYILGNGAAEVIDLVISSFKSILIVVPSFVEYELDAKKWGLNIEYSYLSSEMEFNYSDIAEKLNKVEAIIIGNPNNPNGGTVDINSFSSILDLCEETEKTVIVDEAFIEFTGKQENSFTSLIEKYKCLFIIRAITKFFAMPGIRFGYGITRNLELASNIEKKQNPWNINCFAELAARIAFKDREYIEKSLLWIEEEREALLKKLRELKCFERVYNTRANFVLCKLKNSDEEAIYEFCMEKGIVVRKASNFKGLDNSFIRLAIKDKISNESLIEALRAFK